MSSLDHETLSVILISLDIGLPLVGLLVAVFGLAMVFRLESPASDGEATVNSVVRFLREQLHQASPEAGPAVDAADTSPTESGGLRI